VGTNNNNPVKKTIYSPSPTSFSEPKTAAFTGFTSSGGNSTSGFNASGGLNKGMNFYCQPKATGGTAFFSALGFRDVHSSRVNSSTAGAVAFVSDNGSYWSAGPSDTPTYARFLGFNSAVVYPQNEDSRAYGFTVRSASE
jgi:hypothetical protein